MQYFKKIGRWFSILLLTLILLFIVIWIALQFPWVQTKVVHQVTQQLSETLHTKVQIQKVDIKFFKTVSLKDVYIEDQKKDTLLFAKELDASIGVFSLFDSKIFLNEISLGEADVFLSRPAEDTLYNFAFLIDAFSKDKSSDTTSSNQGGWDFGIGNVLLEKINLSLDDKRNGLDLKTDVGNLALGLNAMDLKNRKLDVSQLILKNTNTEIIQNEENLPQVADNQQDNEDELRPKFPYSGWNFQLEKLNIENSDFYLKTRNPKPNPVEIDFRHLQLNDINLAIEDFLWDEENLNANIQNIQVNERSGLQLQKFQADFKMSPQQIVLENLNINTPVSRVRNTSLLKFNQFSDLGQAFDKVIIASNFSKTKIAYSDLQIFVAALGEVPFLNTTTNRFLELDGNIAGTLQKFTATSFRVKIRDALLLDLDGTVQNVTNPKLMQLNVNLNELSTSYENATAILKDINLPVGLKNFGTFQLQGKVVGRLDSLNVEQFSLNTDANTSFDITGKINGLPDAKNLKMDLVIENLNTRTEDLAGFTKKGMPKLLDSLGNIQYRGKFDGTLTTFDLVGKLQSDLGDLESDLFLEFDENYAQANYEGDLQLNSFQLGKLLENEKIGEVTFTSQLKGSGMSLDSLDAKVKMKIDSFDYSDYKYQDVAIDGLFKEKIFTGKLDFKDPNAAIDFDGKISFDEALPIYQFTMMVDTLNFHELNLVKDELSLHTKMDMNFIGTNVDNFDGQINLSDIFLQNQNGKFETDTLQVIADKISPTKKELAISSSFLTGKINGDYDFLEMQDFLFAYLNEYFSLENLAKDSLPNVAWTDLQKDQVFQMEMNLKDAQLFSMFAPQLENLDGVQFDADFNSKEKKSAVNFSLQNIILSGIGITNLKLTSKGDNEKIDNQLTINNLKASKGINFPVVSFKNKIQNDKSNFQLHLQNDTIAQLLNIAADLTPTLSGFQLQFEEEIMVNNNPWNISLNNAIQLDKKRTIFEDLIFTRDQQKLGIKSLVANAYESIPPVEISFQDFEIKELSKIANIKNTSFEGLLNGAITLIDPLENLHYNADLSIPNLSLNEQEVGDFSLDFSQPKNTKNINVNVLLKGEQNNLNVTGDYAIDSKVIDIKADIQSLETRIIDPILIGILGKSEGTVNGNIAFNGTFDQPNIKGKLNLNQISTLIDFNQSRYTIPEGQIIINNQELNLGTLTLIDERNDQAILKGSILHDFFSNLRFDFNISTERFTFLKTQSKDNALFYGNLFLSANADITGSVENPLIEAKAKTLEGSDLSISAFSEEETFLEEDYIIFGNPTTFEEAQKEKGKTIYEIQKKLPAEIRVALEASDDAIFRMIVDPLTGDQLECKGNSNLQINLTPSGEIKMYGSYVIESGEYRFSYTDLVRRNFQITKGSSVFFNGDLLNARFNVTAKYSTKATPYELISTQTSLSSSEISFAQRRQQVEVLMNLQGDLTNPELTFDIQLPDSEGTILSSEVERKLAELRTDQAELNKQVFGLLFFNGFIASNSSSSFSATEQGQAVVLSSVSKLVSNQLNQLADRYVKGFEINLDLSSYQSKYANEGEGATVTELGIGVTKRINDRLSVTAGGNLDLNSDQEKTGFSQLAGDFVLEYKLTKSGNYLIKVFRKSDYDVLNEENSVRTGVGFTISRSFGGVKKAKEKEEEKKEMEKKKNEKQ